MSQLQEIKNTLAFLEKKKTILYPTDTVWGIGCDATSVDAVKEIYRIKKRSESKSLVVLVSSFYMLRRYVRVTSAVKELLRDSERPTTIIYSNPQGIAKNAIASDNTVAIRIVQNEFCRKLIKRFGKPIVSTSANISGNPTPKSFKEIELAILESVDYVVNLQRDIINSKPSRILKIEEDGTVTIIRD